MDDTETQNIIAEQVKNLPQDVKDAVFSVDYSAILDQISKKNKLLIDQEGKLETETTLVMVGLEPLADYKKNLLKNAGIDFKIVDTIIADVNDLIFKKIRVSLQKMNEEMEGENSFEEQKDKKEELLNGIENPSEIGLKEGAVSFSSLASNSGIPLSTTEVMDEGVEISTPINTNISDVKQLPPAPKATFLITNTLSKNPEQKIEDVVVEKMGGMTSLPKESVVIEEASKIPMRTEIKKVDPYRESVE